MNQQQVNKEYVRKLSGLCDGESIPSHKTSGNGHRESCERDAYQAGEIQDKARMAYRERVLALLGADADDWVFIARIFEDLRPQWFSRIDSLRQNILLHTDPDKKYQNWLEPQKGKLNPNKDLRGLIEQFRNELLYEADLAGTKPEETKQNVTPAKCWGIIKRIPGWIFKKTSHFILTVIGAVIVTIVVDIFADFGWLQSIKAFFYSILWPK